MKLKILIYLIFISLTKSYSQDNCANATIVSSGNYTITTIDGPQVPSPICAINGAGASFGEWFLYIPTENYTTKVTSNINENSPRIDTRLHIYSGDCNNLTCVGGDDDSGANNSSTVTFNAVLSTNYYIAWDNRWNASGFTFNISEEPTVAPILPPVTFTKTLISSILGTHKNCIVDLNGDYLDDIVTVSPTEIQINYQTNSGFTSTSIVNTTTAVQPSWSIAAGDIDKNGFNDLVYGGASGVTFMYANATGTDYTEFSSPNYIYSQRSNFVDINTDGHLDAFICHDVAPNVSFMNDGFGALSFVQGGLGDFASGGNYGSIWTDIDNDGDTDLFISKCRGGNSGANINELHINNGDLTYTNIANTVNMADPIQTWSSAWADYDNDGDMDALVGASSIANGSHKLMQNNGTTNGVLNAFSDITLGSGWDTNVSLGVEHVAYDFDNDGFVDIFGAGNKIMFNKHDLTFLPFNFEFTNGPIGDLNNDGFLDIQNSNDVYYNNKNENNWIKISLQGINSNKNGIGARVELYGTWGKQIRDVRSGEGFKYMNSLNTHFGIGTANSINMIKVIWPSGIIDIIQNPNPNQTLHIIEGNFPLSATSFNGKKIKIYPNPTTDYLTISNLEELNVSSINIIDTAGKNIKTITSNYSKIDVSNLTEGLYILSIETTEGKRYGESFLKKY